MCRFVLLELILQLLTAHAKLVHILVKFAHLQRVVKFVNQIIICLMDTVIQVALEVIIQLMEQLAQNA